MNLPVDSRPLGRTGSRCQCGGQRQCPDAVRVNLIQACYTADTRAPARLSSSLRRTYASRTGCVRNCNKQTLTQTINH